MGRFGVFYFPKAREKAADKKENLHIDRFTVRVYCIYRYENSIL